jgi:sugar lactone lactonase YvrE
VPGQPSGLSWLPDGRLLVVSMRDARVLRREADGTLVTHAELAGHVTGHPNDIVVAPDGCCLDAEGALWVADGLGGRLIRVREPGEIVDQIVVGSGVYACMLGGDDGRTLFACAAPDFDENARSAAREGQLLAIRVDVPHAGRP